jgi:prepilin-type N-terminal cleavage/methylation domain-containing protein
MRSHIIGSTAVESLPDGTSQTADSPVTDTSRSGMTLVEVIVAMALLGAVLLGLGAFGFNLSQATSSAQLAATATQLVSDGIETVKGSPRYTAIESLYVKTESPVVGFSGYTRQTMVTHVGGAITDSTDYKIVTVQVTNPLMKSLHAKPDTVRSTTVISPF